MKRLQRTVGLALAGFTGLGLSGVALAPAGAAQPSSTLVASPNPVNIDVVSPTSAQVTVNLDPASCLNSLKNGNAYSITAVSQDTTVATVSQAQAGPVQCSGDNQKGLPTSETFTVSVNPAVCSTDSNVTTASTSVLFDPVTNPQGIGNKLHGVSVPVNVSSVPLCSVVPPPPPPPNGRAAAPSVAAGFLLADNGGALTSNCKTNIPYKGNGWFGAVISTVAHDMPIPESIKDNTTLFPDDSDWTTFVQNNVTAICSGGKWVNP